MYAENSVHIRVATPSHFGEFFHLQVVYSRSYQSYMQYRYKDHNTTSLYTNNSVKKNKFPAKIQVISILNNHPDKKWLHTFGNYQWELKIWKLQYISICPTNNIIHVQSTWINIICVKKATLYVRHGDTADSKCCNDKGYRYINKFKQQKIL